MAMPPPPRSRSAGMRSIRRELQRRRLKLNKAAKSSSVDKMVISAREDRSRSAAEARDRSPPPLRRQEAPLSSTISHARRDAAAPPQRSVPVSSLSRSTAAASSVGSACRYTPAACDACLRPGTLVGVRTRTTRLKTGQVLVLWLKAMIVSRTDDGGYEVIYDGNWPPGDPYGTVHVSRHHVRLIKTTPPPPAPSVATSSCASAAATATATAAMATARNKKMRRPDEQRPITAGKNLRLIRSLVATEMELP
ncbi:hypothetical protein BS78_04G144600 [Paspalum vaginatum]|nr:hypothetical protein BS78_04G144600 [Paspalum vaginatum]